VRPFTIYPAIDLKRGQVVRLEYGDPQRQTVFSDDPLVVAQSFIEQGATWLHIVNLDGAFDEAGRKNWRLLPHLVKLDASVQFGGGLRQMTDVERALALGVDRVILGTAAVEDPDLLARCVARYGPERIVAALDARQGQIKTRGWRKDGALSAQALARQLARLGLQKAIHTDIGRDGVLTGLNAAASARLARDSGLQLIASGGVASLDDVRRAKALSGDGLCGVVIGRALYDGRIELAQALAISKEAGQ
jgi:phosphoribosylformimino-5-aminoimidazole carboxamide ribotide isomerase